MQGRFLQSPNVPRSRVSLCVTSGDKRHSHIVGALEAVGVACILSENCKSLPRQVAYHADMQLLHLGSERFAFEKSCTRLRGELAALGAAESFTECAGSKYPDDCVFNALCLGGTVYCGRSSEARLRDKSEKGVFLVKQGYARCSCAVVSENAVITADKGIASALKGSGVDCLVIPPGEIALDGYDYGFIGGCCGLIAPDELAFTGEVSRLSYGGEIEEFCEKHGVKITALCEGVPEDIGGILPIAEYSDSV